MATEHTDTLEPLDMWIDVDGRHLHYITAGSGSTPVVFLHGGIVDAATLSWGGSIAPFAHERRVIALDLPGYGSSSRPEAADYTTAYHTDVLGDFLDALNISPVTLVGVSMGGGIALQYALYNQSRVQKLVLVDSHGLGRGLPHGYLTYILSRLPQLNELSISLLSRNRRLAKRALGGIVNDVSTLSRSVVDEFYRLLQRPDAGLAFRRWRRHEVDRSGYRTDFSDRLGDLGVPTLLVHGAEDPLFPVEWSRRTADRIPDATLDVRPDCGHWPQREQTEAFNEAVLSFLDGER
ncbi:alpha/beta fold hydrolase [Natranaeroarchaeum aerophilus]|uniref:Alpha/beta hydrolase n=1 Tax=Natranaeroarchaeum aerophilus TaxID=2917711 RepID=A0AAE3FTA6_9EURY|nr:alpha/beta hydrolase [Natranaeroarchaeum aerophilus]MCL9814548.1 alpha/beta hydrolase [Natranaeroarchaeum aerophilus]